MTGREHLARAWRRVRLLLQFRALYRLLRGNLDDLPDAVLVIDARGRVRLANLAAARRFGVAHPRQLAGRAADALLARHLPSLQRELPPLAGAVDLRAFALETADGSQDDDLLVKGVPRTTRSGRLRGWIVTLVDIGSVREAQRRRDEALRFISHDMRAPQASILSLIEMRRLRGATDNAEETLARIGRLARQSVDLADGFVRLARAESGIYIFERTNLSGLVLEAADQLWAQASAARVKVTTGLPPDAAWCAVEPSLLSRALVNLLDNAIKFSRPAGQVRCDVRREGPWWRISVHDDGVGIAPHELPLLFQRFRRLASPGHAQPAGAGLGLVFVKAVVMQHKGHIEVFSAPGRGSEFRVSLPGLAPRSDFLEGDRHDRES